MKILFLTATYYPSTNGVAISVKTTMEALLKKGHKVTVLAPENSEYKDSCGNIIRYSSLPNPLNSDYPIPVLPLNSKIVNLLLNRDFDIVHAHHPFHIAWFAEKFAKACKSAFVFTYHTKYEYYADTFLKFLPQKYRANILKLGTEHVCKNADLVIAPSRTLKAKLKRQYPNSIIEAIPTGVSFPKTSKLNKGYLRNLLNIDKRSIILLSLSRVAEEKNIKLAINALAALPKKYHLVIAGTGSYEKVLKEMAKKLKLNNRISFLGGIDHKDVPKIMCSADIFLFTSVNETQGLNLLEAMFAGLPVAAVRSSISEEWVPNEAGILTGNKADQFAKGIVKISNGYNSEKRKLIKKWVSSFTLDRTTDTLLNKYQEAIDRKKQTKGSKTKGS